MDILNAAGEIARDILVAIGVLTVLFVVTVVLLVKMRRDNPAKRMLRLLSYRLAATLLAAVFAIPIEPIPIADAVYDLGIPAVLIWYWLRLFRDFQRPPSLYPRRGLHEIEHKGS